MKGLGVRLKARFKWQNMIELYKDNARAMLRYLNRAMLSLIWHRCREFWVGELKLGSG